MLITRASEYTILSLILLSSVKEPMDSETLSRELSIPKSFLEDPTLADIVEE